MAIEKLTCQNCGAPLDSNGKCSYCGTIYNISRTWDNTPVYVVEHTAPVETLRSRVEIPWFAREHFRGSENAFRDMSLSKLKQEMADALLAVMQVDVREDPCRQVTIIDGRVRVVPPDFMF